MRTKLAVRGRIVKRGRQLRPPPADSLPPPAGEPEWVGVTTDLLRSLLRCRTVNPPGREEAAAGILARFAERAGLEVRVLPFAPGRAHAVLELPGLNRALDPVLAVTHLDVVAPGRGWTRPPFAALLEDGYVWGRGAIDAKGAVAVWAALLARRAAAGPLPRTLRLIAAAGEEHPTGALAATLEAHPELARAWAAFGEGGGYIRGHAGRWFTTVGVAECGRACRSRKAKGRRPLVLRAGARAPASLCAFLGALAEGRPDLRAALTRLLEDFPAGADITATAFQDWIERVAGRFGVAPDAIAAMASTQSLAVPRRKAPRGHFTVPPGAVPPEDSTWLWPATESTVRHPAYRAISAALADDCLPGLGSTRALPVITRGRTDLTWYRARGVACYGLLPLGAGDRPESVHGPDERLSIEAIRRSLRVLEAITLQVASEPVAGAESPHTAEPGIGMSEATT